MAIDSKVTPLPVDDDFGLVSFADIEQRGLIPYEYEIEPILEAEDTPAFLTGPPGVFKTFVLMSIVQSIMQRTPLFGVLHPQKERPSAVILNLDGGRKATHNRIVRLGEDLPENAYVATWREFSWERFKRLAAQHEGGFIGIDCFSAIYVRGESKGDPNEEMRLFIGELKAIYEDFGLGGMMTDHTARVEREDWDAFAGPQQKRATMRQGIALSRDRNVVDGPVRIRFGCLKMSEAEEFRPFEIDFSFIDGRLAAKYLGAAPRNKAEANVAVDLETVCNALEIQPASQPGIMAATGLSKERVSVAVSRGMTLERIRHNGLKANASRYELTPAEKSVGATSAFPS